MDVPHAKRSKVASNRHSRDDELAQDWFVPAHRLVMPWCSQPIATMGASLSCFLALLTAVNRKAAQPYFVMGSRCCFLLALEIAYADPPCPTMRLPLSSTSTVHDPGVRFQNAAMIKLQHTTGKRATAARPGYLTPARGSRHRCLRI